MIGCCCLVNGIVMLAQSGPVASGGQASGTGGTVSFSIGQVDYITCTGTGGTITEGLQQPYEIFVITGIEEESIQLAVSIYPNPTRDQVTLTVGNMQEAMSYQLYDLLGNLVCSSNITSTNTSIDMNGLAMATYFIKVLTGNTEIKTFRIIKNI